MKRIFTLVVVALMSTSIFASTCAEVLAAINAAGGGSTAEMTVVGYVTEIVDYPNPLYSNITFWIADQAGAANVIEVYRLSWKGYDKAPSEIPVVGDQVTIKATFKLYINSQRDSFPETNRISEWSVSKACNCTRWTADDLTITDVNVQGAIDIADALLPTGVSGDKATTIKYYRVIGYNIGNAKNGDFDSQHHRQSFYMSDEVGVKMSLQAYRASTDTAIEEGDYVGVTGQIQKYYYNKSSDGTLAAAYEVVNGVAQTLPESGYSISLLCDPAQGTVTGPSSALIGNKVTIRAIPNRGYSFAQWSDGDINNPRDVIITRDTTFTAEFYKLPTYKVSATCENGQVYGTGEYLYNEQASLEVFPISGYSFKQWSDGNTDNPRSIIVTQDTAFVAVCSVNQYTISVSSSDEKMGTVTGGGTYNYGEKVVLTATPIGNNQFYKWHDSNTENPRTITVTQDSYYRAIFGIKQCTLSVVANDIIGGSVQGSGTFDYGTQVEISAKPNSGYQFLKWSNGAKYNPYTFTIVEDMDLIAFFQKTEAEVVDATNVDVTPQDNSVTVVWPAVSGAATYELVVKDKSGAVICTLVFNAQGQLTQIVFSAPGRDHAPQQTQSSGFSFTVTGLDEGTSYDLTLSAKSSDGKVLDQQVKSFTTTGTTTSISNPTKQQIIHCKFIRNGQLFINHNGQLFNVTGTRVK